MGGAKTFEASKEVHQVLKQFESQGKIVAAICAAPIALKAAHIGNQRQLTSHPCVKDQLESTYVYKEDRVVVDGKLVTSRGPGTAFEFALTLVRLLAGDAVCEKVKAPMLLPAGV